MTVEKRIKRVEYWWKIQERKVEEMTVKKKIKKEDLIVEEEKWKT